VTEAMDAVVDQLGEPADPLAGTAGRAVLERSEW
jgi:hypothetical protein